MARTPAELQWKLYRQMKMAICCGGSTGGGAVQYVDFTIGDGDALTPLDGSTDYTNPLMEGKSIAFFKNGVGFITEGTGVNQYSRVDTSDTITLEGGSVFSDDETYILFIFS